MKNWIKFLVWAFSVAGLFAGAMALPNGFLPPFCGTLGMFALFGLPFVMWPKGAQDAMNGPTGGCDF